jgi:polysaccharide export outer membrane protein
MRLYRFKLVTLPLAMMLVCFVTAQQDAYRLRQEDVLHIQVRRLVSTTPDVDQDVAVDQNGYVNPPFLAPIKAEGMTIVDLEKDLRTKYVALFKLQPEQTLVSAIITSYRPLRASVVGAVPKPGTYTLKPGDTLLTLLSQGGGTMLKNQANLKRASLIRGGSREAIPVDLEALFFAGDLSQNYQVMDGDQLIVPELRQLENTVVVWGTVLKGGPQPFTQGMRVMDAIVVAGEIPKKSKYSGTLVIRRKKGSENEHIRIHCDMVDFIRKGDSSQNILLQPRDIVFVPDSGNPDMNGINSFLSFMFLLDRVGLNVFGN